MVRSLRLTLVLAAACAMLVSFSTTASAQKGDRDQERAERICDRSPRSLACARAKERAERESRREEARKCDAYESQVTKAKAALKKAKKKLKKAKRAVKKAEGKPAKRKAKKKVKKAKKKVTGQKRRLKVAQQRLAACN